MVTPSLSASWGGDITALLSSAAARCWQQSCGSHSSCGYREAEGCSPSSQGPSGSSCSPQRPVSHQRGQCQWSTGGWAAPLVYPTSTLRRQGSLMGCHRCRLSTAKKKRGCPEISCRSSCALCVLYRKKEVFFLKMKQKGKIRLLKYNLCRNYLVIMISFIMVL